MFVITQPEFRTTSDDTWGIGDVNMTLFLLPAQSRGLIWGVGPIFQFPAGRDEVLSFRKWPAGHAGMRALHTVPLGARSAGEQSLVVCRV
jgi:hypothetical protein